MAEDIEDISFLPGESLNRKSVYEPSIPQRCRQLVCSRGRATAIIVVMAIFILCIALIAAFARSGSSSCEVNRIQEDSTTPAPTPDFIATNGENFPWKNIRLPESVIPELYDISLNVDLVNKKFSGMVKIYCHVKKATNQIILHSKQLNISNVLVNIAKEMVKVTKVLEYLKNEQISIELQNKLSKGTQINISLEFKGNLVQKLAGFYLSSYKDKDGIVRYLASTQFEPTSAREAFPCFDEPAMKANFSMSILRDENYISLFNMPLESSTAKGDNLVLDKFATSVRMSTYLVAFVVCDFAAISDKTRAGTNVTVYAPKDQIYQAHYALHVAVTVLDYYNKLFRTPYPLPKQDLVAIPDFAAGAMENWGLITYRMTAILYDPEHSSSTNKQWVALVVAHELAHQWFGNLVTMKWWNDLWLNEGFASFVEYLGTDHVEKSWQMDEQFLADTLQRALVRDSLKSSHPIAVAVHNPDQINDLFDAISYDKGSSIIRMLKNFLGADNFDKGISTYLQKYKYGNAETKDLWQALQQSSDMSDLSVKEVMDTWTKQMGYPLITVSHHGNKISVSQKRFLSFPNSTISEEFTSSYGYKWHIPYTYAVLEDSGKLSPGKIWIHPDKVASFDIKSGVKLVKGNFGMVGFYRVNYDAEMWEGFIEQLNTDHKVFSQSDRSGLIDDAFELARAGLISQTIPLRMTKYLSNEDDYLPWESAIAGLRFIKHRIQDKPAVDLLKKYILNLIQKQIQQLGWRNDGSHLTKRLRSLLLDIAINEGDEAIISEGKKKFAAWMKNTSNVDPELQTQIYNAGIMYGGLKEWKFVWNQYLNELVPSRKNQLKNALGRTKDDAILARFLQYGLDKNVIKHQDLSSVIRVVSYSIGGQLLAWRFVQRNWNDIRKWFAGVSFTIPTIIKSCTTGFSTPFDLKEVEEFFKKNDAGPGRRAVQTARESIQLNIQWLNVNEDKVTTWLKENVH